MTPLPAIDSLTPEAIRVLCAEKLGWKMKCEVAISEGWPNHDRWIIHPSGWVVKREELPDFLADANAALTLCAWMADKGWVYYASNDSGGPSMTFVHHSDSDEPSDCHTGTANTFALAVAKAFCVANGLAV